MSFFDLVNLFSYNFHRGVDIRCSTYTNVYAVADGTVRINGSHSGYSSSIVQVYNSLFYLLLLCNKYNCRDGTALICGHSH